MIRGAFLILAAVVASLLAPSPGQTQGTLKLADKFEGELNEQTTTRLIGNPQLSYGAALPVTLKAGQSIHIAASVVGKDRQVALGLYDPAGKSLGYTTTTFVKSAHLKVEEVNATGVYKIVIASSHIGPFTLRASLTDADLTAKDLEDEIQQLEKKLAEKKKKLADLKAKGGIKEPRDK